jgi:hypothetical protein
MMSPPRIVEKDVPFVIAPDSHQPIQFVAVF